MIRYSLVCADAHPFEGWFRSSDDFDHQAERGLVVCPHCGDTRVSKALMAPRVVTSENKAAPRPAETQPGEQLPVAAVSAEAREMLTRLKALKAKLIEGSEDVGARFVEEARRMHFGETPARPVHGQASAEEARALVEEGIDILALPVLPGERN